MNVNIIRNLINVNYFTKNVNKTCFGLNIFLNLCLHVTQGNFVFSVCRPLVVKMGSDFMVVKKQEKKNLTHRNIYLSNVLHTATVYNTALKTQQNKSISYKIK